MRLAWLKVEGPKGVGSGLKGEIRSVGLQTMPHSQRGSRAFTAQIKPKVNNSGRLNQIKQAILYVYTLTYVSQGETRKSVGWRGVKVQWVSTDYISDKRKYLLQPVFFFLFRISLLFVAVVQIDAHIADM